jgi:hypothetical protein
VGRWDPPSPDCRSMTTGPRGRGCPHLFPMGTSGNDMKRSQPRVGLRGWSQGDRKASGPELHRGHGDSEVDTDSSRPLAPWTQQHWKMVPGLWGAELSQLLLAGGVPWFRRNVPIRELQLKPKPRLCRPQWMGSGPEALLPPCLNSSTLSMFPA